MMPPHIRSIILCSVFLLLCGVIVAQPPPSTAKPIGYDSNGNKLPIGIDAIVLKHGSNSRSFVPIADSDAERGNSLAGAVSASADGDTVKLGNGVYQISDTLAANGISIEGNGSGQTTIKLANLGSISGTKNVINTTGSTKDNIHIKGLLLDCNGAGQTATNINVQALGVRGSNVSVVDVKAINFVTKGSGGECFVMSAGNYDTSSAPVYNVTFENCEVTQPAAVVMSNGISAFFIGGQTSSSNPACNTFGNGWVAGGKFINCTVRDITTRTTSSPVAGRPTYIHAYGFAAAKDCLLQGSHALNLVKGDSAHADATFYYHDSYTTQNVTIADNIADNVNIGIFEGLNAPSASSVDSQWMIHGNYIYAVQTGIGGDPARLSYAQIRGNRIKSDGYGLDFGTGPTNSVIENNTIDAPNNTEPSAASCQKRFNYKADGTVVFTPTRLDTKESALVLYDTQGTPKKAASFIDRVFYGLSGNASAQWEDGRFSTYGGGGADNSAFVTDFTAGDSEEDYIAFYGTNGNGAFFVQGIGEMSLLDDDAAAYTAHLGAGGVILRQGSSVNFGGNFSGGGGDYGIYDVGGVMKFKNSGGSLTAFSAPFSTSAALAGLLSDETGFTTGAQAVFSINPVLLYPPNAMSSHVIDVTKKKQTDSISAATAYTLSVSPPTVGQSFAWEITTDSTARVITLPTANSATWKSVERKGAIITTLTAPASSTIHLFAEYEGSNIYRLYGEPLTVNDATAKTTPVGADSVYIYDSVAGADAKATITNLSTALAGLSAFTGAFQPLDSDLTSWAAITRASGFDTFTVTPSGANFVSLQTGALPVRGTTTNDNASAGFTGEYVSSLIASGSAVSLTTATAANVTTISLTAGDWDVAGNVNFSETTSTVTARSAGISITTATLPTDGSEAYCGVQSVVTSETNTITLPRKRISVSGTTTVYLVGSATFSAGTCAEFGAITARRVR